MDITINKKNKTHCDKKIDKQNFKFLCEDVT